jgi:NAD(P)-dependent dehydrogenase (short-subunit alcohol dehydrogenase family)
MKRLANKVALITGGSRGMGRAIAKRLAEEGADISITYARGADKAAEVVKEIRQTGRRAIAIAADSQDPHAITTAVERTVSELGAIDILVNNAGIFEVSALTDITLEDYDRTMSINVRAVFLASQAAARHMRPGGRIISIGSCLGDRVHSANLSLYAMSKSALTGLTKALARELGKDKITVNIIQPGPVNTDMNPANGAHADFQRSRMAIPEYGEPEDIAAAVAWLASPEGKYITGASIAADGGTNA